MSVHKIHGKAFLEWLKSFEVVPGNTYRVVIEASYDSPVIIYAEMYGTSAMIEVEPPPELTEALKIIKGLKTNEQPITPTKDELGQKEDELHLRLKGFMELGANQPSTYTLFDEKQRAAIRKWEHPDG